MAYPDLSEILDQIGITQIEMLLDYDGQLDKHFVDVLANLVIVLRETKKTGLRNVEIALDYLEQIPIQIPKKIFTNFGSPVIPLREILNKNLLQQAHKFSSTKSNISLPSPLPDKYADFLKDIYKKLAKVLNEATVWLYPYVEKQPFHPAIKKWREIMMNSTSEPEQALEDFSRGIKSCCINEINYQTKHDARIHLAELVEKSNYPEEDKEKLFKWICQNGGQDNNRIVDTLLSAGEFTRQKNLGTNFTRANYVNWSVDNTGRLGLEMDFDYFTFLTEGLQSVLYRFPNESLISEISAFDIETKGVNKKENLAPLLRVKIKVELLIIDDVVVPKIAELTLMSYTPSLISPAEKAKLQNKEESRESPKPR